MASYICRWSRWVSNLMMNISENPSLSLSLSLTHTHKCMSFYFSNIVLEFGEEFLVTLEDHFRSHLEASVVVFHNVKSEWTILKQDLYTRRVTHTHSKNAITHLEFNWCIDRLNYQILVYTRTFIFFLAAISIIPWPGRPPIVYTGLDPQTYWILLIWLCHCQQEPRVWAWIFTDENHQVSVSQQINFHHNDATDDDSAALR